MFDPLKEQLPLATFNASTIIQDLSFSQRAESARADTGRRCPKSGVGEDFLVRRPFFTGFDKEKKSPKIGSSGKNGFLGRSPIFWASKKHPLLYGHHVLATAGQSCAKKKESFSEIIIF